MQRSYTFPEGVSAFSFKTPDESTDRKIRRKAKEKEVCARARTARSRARGYGKGWNSFRILEKDYGNDEGRFKAVKMIAAATDY